MIWVSGWDYLSVCGIRPSRCRPRHHAAAIKVWNQSARSSHARRPGELRQAVGVPSRFEQPKASSEALDNRPGSL
jgi:hypothetical protein